MPHRVSCRWGPARVIIAVAWVLLTSTTRLEAQTPAPAITEPAADNVNSLSQIEVQAQRRNLKKRVQAFIAAVTPPTYADSLLRWNHAICPVIMGPPPDQSARILAHVSQIAIAAGVAIQPKPCTTNLFIAAWAYPEPMLTAWGKRDHLLFGRTPQKKVDAFINTPRPVRVWYNTVTTAPEETATFAEIAPNATDPLDAAHGYSLFYFDEVQSFASVIVVVDTKRAAAVKARPAVRLYCGGGAVEDQTRRRFRRNAHHFEHFHASRGLCRGARDCRHNRLGSRLSQGPVCHAPELAQTALGNRRYDGAR